VQFVVLIYQGTTPTPATDAWSDLPPEEQRAAYADYAALNKTPGVEPGHPMGLPERATAVQVVDGTAVVTSGPYLRDPLLAVGGCFALEAADLDAAVAIAARIPAARLGGGIEIRPVETYW
jgi:hypothetical protein